MGPLLYSGTERDNMSIYANWCYCLEKCFGQGDYNDTYSSINSVSSFDPARNYFLTYVTLEYVQYIFDLFPMNRRGITGFVNNKRENARKGAFG